MAQVLKKSPFRWMGNGLVSDYDILNNGSVSKNNYE